MRPFTRTIIELFDGKRRYLIPLYQRQYAWKVSPQLELLWEDIERVARKLEREGNVSAPHFMGAIVISQIKTFGKQVQAFEVIDGQQRLTTFQLLLAALRDEAKAVSEQYEGEVTGYLFNNGVMETPEVERFKLWPSLTDRSAFTRIAHPGVDLTGTDMLPEEDGAVRPAVAAHAFFRERIKRHIHPDGVFDVFRLEKLFEALRVGLAAVSIELEGGDDAQTIFETLNSRGVDLAAGDLMRNFIFQRAKGLGQTGGSLNVDALYRKYWLPLDGWFWREGDTRGRQSRPRLDWLLVDHLSMKRADLVSIDTLFDAYRKWILEDEPFASVEEELAGIAASAAIHRRLAEQSPDDALGRFGRLAKAFDVSTAMSLVLYLAVEADLADELPQALVMIGDWIVRRDICGLTTKNYNRFFVDVISKMRASEGAPLAALAAILSSSNLDIARWPDNSEWKQAWLGRDQYRANRQPRLRYIFEALEERKRSSASEVVAIKSDLTLEHIMPVRWQDNWPLPEDTDEDTDVLADIEKMLRPNPRDAAIHKLGNLTLLTQGLNSSVSNGPFSVKMPAVRAQSALVLNRELHDFDEWDEQSIHARGAALFETARTIWPGPPTPS